MYHQFHVSESNVTRVNPDTGYHEQVSSDDHGGGGLFRSLQLAGSSFGIATEFHYRIFDVPELIPVIALVYIEDKADLWKFERAGSVGR